MNRLESRWASHKLDLWIWAAIAFVLFALVIVAQGAELARVGDGADAKSGSLGVVCRGKFIGNELAVCRPR